MKRTLKLSAAILIACLALPGCAWMSKSGRQQMAYRNYVRKHVRQRQRAIARAQARSNRHPKLKNTEVSEPKLSATAEPVPDSVTASGAGASENESAPAEP